jgi:Spy/CpxP family protein refolding chaperone
MNKTRLKSAVFAAMLTACAAMLVPASALADGPNLPSGWTFRCEGTTGVYEGPNGSYMVVPNSRFCDNTVEEGPDGP